jgi:hypothetical protein
MQFTTARDFPAGLDRLWATFGHPAYPQTKYRALGAVAVRLKRFDVGAQSIEVDLERVVPVDIARLPGWAHIFAGREQTLRHHTAWRRVDPERIDAELEIVPVGLPVRARGTGAIVELAARTSRMSLTWRVDSILPVWGGRVERLFAEQVQIALEQDHRFTLAALRGADPAPDPGASVVHGATRQ